MKKTIEIELRGDRLYAITGDGVTNVEMDISAVWKFFREFHTQVEWKKSKEVSDMRDAQIEEDAQERLLDEIDDISDYLQEDAWSRIKTHLTLNKPKS